MHTAVRYSIVCIGVALLALPRQANANDKVGPRLKALIEHGHPHGLSAWVYFSDKGSTEMQQAVALQTLVSDRSIRRRLKVRDYSEVVDVTDLPVNPQYVQEVQNTGARIRHRSRWLNAVSVGLTVSQLDSVVKLPFVRSVELLGRYRRYTLNPDEERPPSSQPSAFTSTTSLDYGPSLGQLQQINVPALHDSGNFGQGVLVGLLDNGFRLLGHEVFDSLNIIATYDFVDHKESVVPNNPSSSFGAHGVYTLSVIAGYKPGQLIGPAFGADYLLARTENDSSETPLEEDNWVAAMEWADSFGVDVTSTSLVYREFDSPYASWTWEDMDGNTTVITRAADIAVSKGIVVVNAAGNFGGAVISGQNTLGAPADGDSVLAVGAVDASGNRATFSSVGPTAGVPARIKPDVMARGTGITGASATNPTGYFSSGSGTSYACPLAAGVVALLLAAKPLASPIEIAEAMKATASNASSPNNEIGWGILNATSALDFLTRTSTPPSSFQLAQNYPNPFNQSTTIEIGLPVPGSVRLEIFNILGRKVREFEERQVPAGTFPLVWDGTDSRSHAVSTGAYIYRVIVEYPEGTYRASGKAMLLR